jgi:acetyl-CoA carboxylase biotin carboxyl carrier protein
VATRDRHPATAGKTPKHSGEPSAPINLEEINQLIDLAIEKGVSELEIERPGFRVKIARHAGVVTVPMHAAGETLPHVVVHTPPRPPSAVEAVAGAAEEFYVVRSPMVGTFYSAPAQGSDAYVRVGDRVQTGQVLCIIEAMKLMNEIESEVAGEIVKCYVENGLPVEYGEPLFDLRPVAAGKRSS